MLMPGCIARRRC